MSSLQPDSPSSRPRRVLIVDDESMVLDALSQLLQREGYRVTSSIDSAQALDMFRAAMGSEPFELVLTDVQMPGMSGLELASSIRTFDPALPIIFMSGALPPGITSERLQGVSPHLLVKPFDFKLLVRIITDELNKSPA